MEMLVPIFAIAFIFSIPLLAIWTDYRKDRALIDKGLYQPGQRSTRPGWALLLVGAILAGLGVAGIITAFAFRAGRLAGIPGLVCLSVGTALIAVYYVAGRRNRNNG